MLHAELLSLLKDAEARIPDFATRVVPASFELSSSDLTAYPLPRGWHWPSCAGTLSTWGAHGVMMRLPLLWQLAVPLRLACDRARAFLFINDPGNMPLGAAAVRQANIDAVITDENDAAAFAEHLQERGDPLPAFLIVAPATAPLKELPPALHSARVTRELHIFPGVPVLVQCAALSKNRAAVFHAAPGYELQVIDGQPSVTGTPDHPLPLSSYTLNLALAAAGTCACGETSWRVQ